jgi:HYDIN/CFA65/VesB-like, Ig-like domain/Repeat of unknown function (DUF5648)
MRFLAVLLSFVAGSACADGRICISRDVLLFGEQAVGTSVTQSSTVSNCGNAPFAFTDVSIHPATASAYKIAATCATGQSLGVGASCNVDVTFAPSAPGQVSGGLWLHNTTTTPDQIITFYGRGADARSGTATLFFDPGQLAFAAQVVGTTSRAQTLTLRNLGPADLTMTALVLNGSTPYDFRFPGTCMLGVAYPVGASCELYFYFTPGGVGTRLARLNVDAPQLASLAMTTISGVGIAVPPPAPTTDVIEFFNASLNHYFLTAVAEEATAIDAGAVGPGWARTGFSFRAYAADTPAEGTLPVCRFFGTPGQGPSAHFFTADAAECALVKANPRWLYEGIAWRADVPANGQCAAGASPVVRFFWPGAIVTDARHRYVKDAAEIARMRSAEWIEEGPVFCSPA